MKPRTWWAIGGAALGVYVICDAPNLLPSEKLGNSIALLAAFTLALGFSIIEQNRTRDLLPSFVTGGFFVALILLPWVEISMTSNSDLYYLFIMGFVLLPIANTLMFIGPRYISAPEVSLMMLLESVLGPFWVWLVFKENLSNSTLIGGIIVLVVLMLYSLVSIKKSKQVR